MKTVLAGKIRLSMDLATEKDSQNETVDYRLAIKRLFQLDDVL